MAFRRPGSLSKGDFGVSYSVKFRDAPPERDSGRQAPPSGFGSTSTAASLPVARYRKQLLYLIEKHATVIIVGETGCGKTTQIPQYLHEAGWTAQGHQVRTPSSSLLRETTAQPSGPCSSLREARLAALGAARASPAVVQHLYVLNGCRGW